MVAEAARRVSAQALKARVEPMIDRELRRCEACMSPAQWLAHRDWITANVVESARLWLRTMAERGEL